MLVISRLRFGYDGSRLNDEVESFEGKTYLVFGEMNPVFYRSQIYSKHLNSLGSKNTTKGHIENPKFDIWYLALGRRLCFHMCLVYRS